MQFVPSLIAKQLTICLVISSLASAAMAADIVGVWSDNIENCSKMYVKAQGGLTFSDKADLYGSGFIVEGDTIKGKMATCKISRRRADGDTLHLIASCATDIMLDTVQFSVRFMSENKLARIYPGVPELEQLYERCKF
jgi:hypothetical protein